MRPVVLLVLALLLVACGDEEGGPTTPPAETASFEWSITGARALRGRSDQATLGTLQIGSRTVALFELSGPEGLVLRLTSPPGMSQLGKNVYEVNADSAGLWHGWLELPGAGEMEHYGRMWGSLVLEKLDRDWAVGDFDFTAVGTDASGVTQEPQRWLTVRGRFQARRTTP